MPKWQHRQFLQKCPWANRGPILTRKTRDNFERSRQNHSESAIWWAAARVTSPETTRGVANIYGAIEPDLKPLRITDFTADDAMEIELFGFYQQPSSSNPSHPPASCCYNPALLSQRPHAGYSCCLHN